MVSQRMRLWITLLGCWLFFGQLTAQYSSIIDRLTSDIPGEGNVTVVADPKVLELVGKPVVASDNNYVQMEGFRINAFSGNGREAKDAALDREKMIKERFPELPTYVVYNPPIFRLRVGDFQHTEEATSCLSQLKKEFPSLSRELFLVPDEINVYIYF